MIYVDGCAAVYTGEGSVREGRVGWHYKVLEGPKIGCIVWSTKNPRKIEKTCSYTQ